MTPVLTTSRLVLRPLEQSDAADLTQAIADWEVIRWLTSPPWPYIEKDAQWFISEVQAGDMDRYTWAITQDGRFLGVVGIGAELGYWLGRAAHGRGIMTEAADAALDHYFSDPDAPALASGYLSGNRASARVLSKVGFRDAGPMVRSSTALKRDVDGTLMQMTRAEWLNARHFEIVTDRLVIRELRRDDWPAVRRIAAQDKVAPMLASVSLPWPEKDAQAWVRRARFHGRPGFRAAITRDGVLIGTCGLGKAPDAPEQTTMYFLDPDHWGQGLVTEAMRAFLGWCYARWDHLDVIDADHFADNPASGHVLRKLGFVECGRSMGKSAARLENAALIDYRLTRAGFAAKDTA